jgi:hypothetical protein
MATVEVGNNERIGFEPKRHVLRLVPAAGGARIELLFSVSSVVPNPTVSVLPFQVDADLFASRLSNQNERMVCRLSGEHLISPTPNGAQLTLAGFIGAEQLREIEEIRAGGDLFLHLVLFASTVVDGTLRMHRGDEHLPILSGEWAPQMERVDAATFVEVLVPMPAAEAYATAARRVREARELLRNNDVDAAMGAARLALEPVRDALGTIAVAAAAPAKVRDRNQDERLAVLVETAYSLLCGAMHDDELTKTFRYTRADAITMIAAVAGLLRHAAEQP